MYLLPKKEKVPQLIMNKTPIVIMAAGVSSRMRSSSTPHNLSLIHI